MSGSWSGSRSHLGPFPGPFLFPGLGPVPSLVSVQSPDPVPGLVLDCLTLFLSAGSERCYYRFTQIS